ncbi:hypothetical protein ACFYRN_25205 [Streptomyces sp. NPDC005227]|uniref:hypothetical protein n=1 Tax=Streptomyces sp. NPDC005227 TaxID=3364707 RepID=UPI0036ADF8B9
MTAPMHISRRTTSHHPLTALRARWGAAQLRYSRRIQTVTFQRLHDGLALDAPDRHDLEAPALERALQRLAIDHGDKVTPADGGDLGRDADREQLVLAACDTWFREIHGPEHRWSPRLCSRYDRLMESVRDSFPGGQR